MERLLSRRDIMKLTGAAAVAAAAGPLAFGQELSAPPMPAEAMDAPADTAILAAAFADGQYVLPPLPYAYDALEPHLDARTLEIHHDKHHAGYVRGLNATLEKLAAARAAGDFSQIQALSYALAFHGSGHVLHSLFWRSMTPGGSAPSAQLAAAIDESFGSFDAAKGQFAAAAKAVPGSGWAVLAWEPVGGKLLILQASKHQDLAIWGVTPLLVCDVWEHAYYLQYANDRGRWVDNFLQMANWQFASGRMQSLTGTKTA